MRDKSFCLDSLLPAAFFFFFSWRSGGLVNVLGGWGGDILSALGWPLTRDILLKIQVRIHHCQGRRTSPPAAARSPRSPFWRQRALIAKSDLRSGCVIVFQCFGGAGAGGSAAGNSWKGPILCVIRCATKIKECVDVVLMHLVELSAGIIPTK